MRVIVVGGGVVGLATAWALVRSGHQAVLVDQGPIPNPNGSSYDQHRLIRYAYGDDEGYTAMVGDAFRAWGELWDDLGKIHYVKTGTIAVSSVEGDETDLSRATYERLGIPHEVLDRKTLDEAMPQYAFDGARYGLFNADGGPLLAERIVRGLADWLRERDVDMREHARVSAVDPASATVILADGEKLTADRLVLATGSWTTKLLPEFRDRTAPSRQVVVYVDPPPHYRAAWAEGPVLAQFRDGLDLYNLPPVHGLDLKFSCKPYRRPGDPDDDRVPGSDEGEAVFAHIRPLLRDGDAYRVLGAKVCYYGLSDSGRFIVEPLAGGEPGLAITNCCGHMFKFGALLGQEITRTVTGDRPLADLACWAAGKA
jgi:sarcosine oxidase